MKRTHWLRSLVEPSALRSSRPVVPQSIGVFTRKRQNRPTTFHGSPRQTLHVSRNICNTPPATARYLLLSSTVEADSQSVISELGPNRPILTYERLFPLFKEQLDPASILRLMPSVISAMEDRNIAHCRRLLRSLIPHLGRNRMIALIPILVDQITAKVDGLELVGVIEGENKAGSGEVDIKAVEKLYDTIIYRLRTFLQRPPREGQNSKEDYEEGPLPLHVRMQVFRLTQHFIHTLHRMPSTSALDAQLYISTSFLNRLFSRRYLTLELRQVLMEHCDSHDIDVTSSWLRHCILSAIEEGDQAAAEDCRKRLAEVERRLSLDKSRQMMSDREELQKRMVRYPLRINHDAIKELLLARNGQSWDETLSILDRYLRSPDLNDAASDSPLTHKFVPQAYHYAWSIFLSRLANDRSIDVDSLAEMAGAMPGTAMIGHTVTPIMHGLIRRGAGARAWDIWCNLVQKENEAKELKGMFVDRVTLAVGTEACYDVSDLDAAVTLVDTWALRPWMPDPTAAREDNRDLTCSLTLDAQNLNVLLALCKRVGRPSIAFRLWAAAQPRYGVHLDDISLNLLLDTARYADTNHETGAPQDMFRSRLREMAEGFSLRHSSNSQKGDHSFDAYDAAGFAKGSSAVLLDPPSYRWGDDHEAKPWQMAKDVFRSVVLGNWPHLAKIKSPLETQHGILDFFGASHSMSSSHVTRRELPTPEARYIHIIPTATTFHSYITLMGYFHLHSEIPCALGWMKELGIKPKWETMVYALMQICENEGPRRWIRGWGEEGESALVRDEGIMRRWLEDWLGSEIEVDERGKERWIVPSEEDVAALRRQLAAKRSRLSA